MPELISADHKFNAGMYQMERINELQKILNQVNGNLLAFNDEYQIFNYLLKFNVCNSLYQEIEAGIAKPKEKEKCVGHRKAIEKGLETYPVHESIKSKVTVNETHWRVIRRWLFRYERMIRQFLKELNINLTKRKGSLF